MVEQEKLKRIQVDRNSFECSITTDVAVFGFIENSLKVLLIKRLSGYFMNHWLLPGGVMEADETLDDCAKKVLYQLTGFRNIHFEQVKIYSELERHPLKRVITQSFYALVKPENHSLVIGGNVERISWFDIDRLPEKIGYDHRQIIHDANLNLQLNLRERLIFGELLPKTFTLAELQNLYERILKIKLDKRNFRKKIFQMDVLTSTGEKKPGVKGGPLLYRYKNGNVCE
ncbi:8-oxo-dGTP diphosphatase [Flagellimonas maritima]|uniref:8-oxo-dGTP diphosphatase n=1 Tax=Flagellimonas maritima TaxID=1383885 RepID=A0A2Z4LP86_9FLAO|nr:NUDIX domain-containing protein [Allomuricauda aurantiaca]AWX43685.1 8-oxo-dGTP diphosphatase [Allomuricauda aurantiaca]